MTKSGTKSGKLNKGTEPAVPADLQKMLDSDPEAMALWRDTTPLARRDWIGWIITAKQEETRARRIEQTASKLKDSKKRPCCYAVVPMSLYKLLGTDPKAKAAWSALPAEERRDLALWIEAPERPAERKDRAAELCSMLATGKKLP